MCGKSFLTPVSLCKHWYSHIEENEQFQCRMCEKRFPFESQLKLHRHIHHRTWYYSCASVNCEWSCRHPGDLAANARSHGKPFNCAHCSYSNTDIRNLRSHMRVHSRDAPFTCKMCGQKFMHSNQLVRHKPKYASNKLKQDDLTLPEVTSGRYRSKLSLTFLMWTITWCNTELSDETKKEVY